MLLFDHLSPDFFLIFSRSNRHLYAQVVTEIYDQYFGVGFVYPKRNDLVLVIYNVLRANPDLWTEDEELLGLPDVVRKRGRRLRVLSDEAGQDRLLKQAQHIYRRLVDTGWLEEEAQGLKVTVDMPPAALLVTERLVALREGLAVAAAGVVVAIRTALNAVRVDGRTNAAGLRKAAENAQAFERSLRVVLSDLRRVERKVMDSDSLEARYQAFFEDFIGEVLLKDLEEIQGPNHPYRHRTEILRDVEDISLSDHTRERVMEGYVEDRISPNGAEARAQLDHDLRVVAAVFGNIDISLDHINRFRRKLESKLSNTIRYAEQGEGRISRRVVDLVRGLEEIRGRSEILGRTSSIVPGPYLERPLYFGRAVLAAPRRPRPPVARQPLESRRVDPAQALRRAMMRDYAQLFQVGPDQVRAYLDRVLDGRTSLEARDMPVTSLEEFLVVDELRRYRRGMPPSLERWYVIKGAEGWRVDEWFRCPNFRLSLYEGMVDAAGS
ncbi:Wadjet anti-phage system protein JetA family protein [Roseospira visakhapatnamensis]|uniref:Uncharacterized protein n=1 Tax=Roseospira visakhapatnamensis TaxID=390880 RepID=A0A7W6RC43_9PROT|nr:Wadjet anti-phage system protein JetA family protein [Roseospira visakhapatnamensis]MBB4265411.1 hypothetical protein [Roseospira visakhapatnamensis]